MKDLILPGTDARLLDRRFEEEELEARAQASASENLRFGAPDIPNAQLVFSPDSGVGVAVKGEKFVCQLPKGYDGRGLELAVIKGGRYIVTHPNHSPLLIDPQRGTTRPL